MTRIIWFGIGIFSAMQAVMFLPYNKNVSNVLIYFVIHPMYFLATSWFLILSFLLLSQAIKETMIAFIQSLNHKNFRHVFLYLEFISYIIGFVYLCSKNLSVAMILLGITVVYLLLSIEGLQHT